MISLGNKKKEKKKKLRVCICEFVYACVCVCVCVCVLLHTTGGRCTCKYHKRIRSSHRKGVKSKKIARKIKNTNFSISVAHGHCDGNSGPMILYNLFCKHTSLILRNQFLRGLDLMEICTCTCTCIVINSWFIIHVHVYTSLAVTWQLQFCIIIWYTTKKLLYF